VVTTSAVGEPEIVPYIAEETTATLAGPPRLAADEGAGEIVEEVASAEPVEYRAEQNEDEHEEGGDRERGADQLVRGEHEMVEDLGEAERPVRERSGKVMTPDSIGEKGSDQQAEGEADRPSRRFEHEQAEQDRRCHVGLGQRADHRPAQRMPRRHPDEVAARGERQSRKGIRDP